MVNQMKATGVTNTWCYKILNVLILNFEFLFLFNLSCGHDRQQEDGLKSYGGKQHALQLLLIKQEHGYLGNYECTLQPGDTQTIVFLHSTDSRLFWMTEQQ